MPEKINLKLRLNEFLRYIKHLRLGCGGNPDVEFEVNGSKMVLTSMTMTQGPYDFTIKRGDLRTPEWGETMLIRLEAKDG